MVGRKRSAVVERLEVRNLLCGNSPATVAFSQASFEVREDGESIGPEIAVTRSCGEGVATVNVRVEPGTANRDLVAYVGNGQLRDSFPVQFEEGETSKTIRIGAMSRAQADELGRTSPVGAEGAVDRDAIFTLLDDEFFEPIEEIQLWLGTSDANLIPAGQVHAQINVIDDDPKSIVLDHNDATTDIVVLGAVDTVAAKLNFQPSGTVVVEPEFDNATMNVTPDRLVFTAGNWSSPQYFTLEGLQPTANAQFSVSIDTEQTNELDTETRPATLGFAILGPVDFEQVSRGLSVANIAKDPQTAGLNPRNLTVAGGYLYFTSDTGTAPSVSLWKSNGTTEGTTAIAELEMSPTRIVGSDQQLLYLVGDQLWTLGDDGTPALLGQDNGRIAEIEQSAVTEASGSVTNESRFDFNGQRFGSNGFRQLSRVVGDISFHPIVDFFTEARGPFAVFEDRFYFVAETEQTGSELWGSDGTRSGTQAVADLHAGPSSGVTSLADSAVFQGELYFAANDGVSGLELWKTDSNGLLQVFDLEAEPDPASAAGSDAQRLTKVNDTVYFVADNGSTSKLQLWATATDSDNASLLAAIPKPNTTQLGSNLIRGIDSQDLVALIPYRDELLFSHNYWYDSGFDSSFTSREFELWKSDGTALGTELILPFYQSYFDYPREVELVGPRFSAVDASGTLFFDGGTYDGTLATATVELEQFSGRQPAVSQFTRVGDLLFFSKEILFGDTSQLYVSTDGLATSTRVSPEDGGVFRPGLIRHGHTSEYVSFDESLFYTAGLEIFDNIFVPQEYSPRELWTSNGTAEGTRQVFTPESGYVANLTVMDSQLFFTTDEPPQLFATDGTADGTVLLREFQSLGIPPEEETHFFDVNRIDPTLDTSDFLVFQNMLYFAADTGSGRELWRSDGTLEGTELFAEINPEEAGSDPVEFTIVGDRLYFSADDGTHGRELWVTDGTAAGTKLHVDINAGIASSDPDELLASEDLLYFVADDGIRGREVWRLDTFFGEIEDVVGDINGDAEVNFADFLVLSANFGNSTENGASDGDLDGNGLVSFTDFLLFSASFGQRLVAVDAVFAA